MMTRHTLQRILLASVIAMGATGVWGIVGVYLVDALPIGDSEIGFGDAVTLFTDGTPLVTRYFGALDAPEYRDLKGKLVPPPLEMTNLTPVYLGRTWAPMNQIEAPQFADTQAPCGFWYFLKDESSPEDRGYFIGYDSHTKRCIGYLGIKGFQETFPSHEQMIPGLSRDKASGWSASEKGLYMIADFSVYQSYMMAPGTRGLPAIFVPTSDGKMYLVDILRRSVELVHQGDPVRSAAKLLLVRDGAKWLGGCIALRTDTSIVTLDANSGRFLKRYLIPEDLRNSDFQFALTSKSEAILEIAGKADSLKGSNELQIVHLHNDGTREDHKVELSQSATGKPFQARGGLRLPAPLLLAAAIALDRGTEIMWNKLEPTWSATFRRLVAEYYPTFLMAVGLSVICAAAASIRLARYSVSRTDRILWPLFVLLMGVPGWIGFRFCRSWPVLDTCVHCNARVPMDHEECVACSTEFPMPAKRGTEVFA
jgi:hypothetical protein